MIKVYRQELHGDSESSKAYFEGENLHRRASRVVMLKDLERLKRQATDSFADLEGRMSENALNIIKLLHKNGHYDDSALKFEAVPKQNDASSGISMNVEQKSLPEYVQVSGKLEIL
uniref:SPX domain-containing protein n=1 Tax=Syphacia muris TaxID=451379 RepID=A0A0N5AT19_9BILA